MAETVMLVFASRGMMTDAISAMHRQSDVEVKHTAVIAKAEDGETVVYEDDISPNEGAITGSTLGALMSSMGIAGLGAFLLPGVGPIIAIGAAAVIGGVVGGVTGGVTARLMDLGISNTQLEALAERLNAGKVAMVVELEGDAAALARLAETLKPYQVEVVRQS